MNSETKKNISEARSGFGAGRAQVFVLIVAASLVVVSLGACSRVSAPASQAVPHLTVVEVEKIAQQAAKDNGAKMMCYHDPSVTFESSGAEPRWRVSYQTKDPSPPGGHFVVLVNDRTSEATYLVDKRLAQH